MEDGERLPLPSKELGSCGERCLSSV